MAIGVWAKSSIVSLWQLLCGLRAVLCHYDNCYYMWAKSNNRTRTTDSPDSACLRVAFLHISNFWHWANFPATEPATCPKRGYRLR